MLRRAALAAAVLVTAALGADLAGRGFLTGALVDLAGRAPVAAPRPSSSASPSPAPPRLIAIESVRFSAVASVDGTCADGCTVTLAVQPSPGRRISVDAPHAFVPRGDAVARGRVRARSPRPERAVVVVPLEPQAPGRVLEGELRVVTCDDETCSVDRAPVSVPLGPLG